MIIHPKRRYPREAHDRLEMSEIDIVAKKCRETDREPRGDRDERDPASENTRQNEQHNCAGERDVNRPGDHRPLRVRYRADFSRA